jgi:hypothetical protein
MDFQVGFNVTVAIAGALCGWVLNSLNSSLKELRSADIDLTTKVQSIEVLVAGNYVKRADIDKLTDAIFAKLDRIEGKLDKKVDK